MKSIDIKEYLIKLGEISLKGLNRADFEKKLMNNIKSKLEPNYCNIRKTKGRLYLNIDNNVSDSEINSALSTTFGISSFTKSYSCKKNIQQIDNLVEQVLKESNFEDNGLSFRVDAKREDKSFFSSSTELECHIAEIVHKNFPSLKVNLKKPDYIISIEIRDRAYIYTNSICSVSGLPVGSSGKALCLLSGGIDSPVSAFMAASRGLHLELVYFHAYPYTSDEALEKVKKLTEIISPYLNGTILHVVNFTPMEQLIEKSVNEKEKTIILRAAMIRVAHKLAEYRRCSALVTGESLSQVASQTLEALSFTTSMTDMLVLRPLIGMDKETIISLSKKIKTYETSILPYSDCCSLFSPQHPMTRPDSKKEREVYFSMGDYQKVEDEAVESREEIKYPASNMKNYFKVV